MVKSFVSGFFRGAREMMTGIKSSQRNRNPHPPAGERVKQVLLQRLKLDLEFYEFVKQRLLLQYRAVTIKESEE